MIFLIVVHGVDYLALYGGSTKGKFWPCWPFWSAVDPVLSIKYFKNKMKCNVINSIFDCFDSRLNIIK